ncbi:mannitol-1-phosphate 5-dehydrogenase [Carnobacterium gallinarum]|uniref:mannitol-1-phosphate 5-dehydrogenase n=1 Tax=Carnobacterium gallinarum TaxID=2749 RepID=UPI0005568729|nr:mannitol-1-phosphate 5-dehydrogenase [Carnobacterium gallinarum]
MKAVHFGAGNIGRGFIGVLLSEAGYEICFVDVVSEVVDALNEKREYEVILANDTQDRILVRNVCGVNSGTDMPQVLAEISRTNLITMAVGPTILPLIAKTLAAGITKRMAVNQEPLLIMACENMIDGTTYLKQEVYELLTEEERIYADATLSFADTAVDRIVPNQSHPDPLTVLVEPFYEWIVSTKGVTAPLPEIPGITYVTDLKPYIERKLFTVNTGHAITAYLGHLRQIDSIDEAIQDEKILFAVRSALEETGALLEKKFGFSHKEHQAYIDKIIERFKNPHISDYVSRVGRSPLRKLGPNDRFVQPARQFVEAFNETPKALAEAIAAALLFNQPEDAEALALQRDIELNGVEEAIVGVTGIQNFSKLFDRVKASYLELAH